MKYVFSYRYYPGAYAIRRDVLVQRLESNLRQSIAVDGATQVPVRKK